MSRRLPAPLAWLAGLLAIYLVAPLAAGLEAARHANWKAIEVSQLVHAGLVSVASASTATVIIALGGIPLGYCLARRAGRLVSALGFAVQLPLALPPLTSGILLLFLVGYATPLGRATGGILTDSFAGIVLAEVFVAAPFLVIAARSAFAASDPIVEGVAATLGRRRLDVFWRVALPIARPGIASGLLLAWLRAFGEFGATVMVAYHPYSLPVYTFVAFGSQGLPAMLPVILPTLILALAGMGLITLAARRRGRGAPWPVPSEAVASVPIPEHAPATAAAAETGLRLRLDRKMGSFCLDIDWQPSARRLAILGASGSGKSVTLKLIAGIERPDGGSVVLGGRDLTRLDASDRRIGYVPQNFGLFPHLTVIENLCFPPRADPAMAARWLDALGLGGLERRYPGMLSLGQQQRVALARALVRPIDLLLLDEPFSALDAPLRARLRDELRALQDGLGATTILVTHDPAEAALLADEVLVLGEGRVQQAGPVPAVFRRPASEMVARITGARSMGRGTAADRRHIAIGDGLLLEVAGPDLEPGSEVGWSIPPAHVRIDVRGPYRGRVEAARPMGMGQDLTVGLGNARVKVLHGGGVKLGDMVAVSIDPEFVQVWLRPRSLEGRSG